MAYLLSPHHWVNTLIWFVLPAYAELTTCLPAALYLNVNEEPKILKYEETWRQTKRKRLKVGKNTENENRTVKRRYKSCYMNAMVLKSSENAIICNSLSQARVGCYLKTLKSMDAWNINNDNIFLFGVGK